MWSLVVSRVIDKRFNLLGDCLELITLPGPYQIENTLIHSQPHLQQLYSINWIESAHLLIFFSSAYKAQFTFISSVYQRLTTTIPQVTIRKRFLTFSPIFITVYWFRHDDDCKNGIEIDIVILWCVWKFSSTLYRFTCTDLNQIQFAWYFHVTIMYFLHRISASLVLFNICV